MKHLLATLLLLFSSQLLAIEPRCIKVNDLYAVNFTAYAPPSKEELKEMSPAERKAAIRPYCDRVPRSGKLYLSVDLLDRDARKMPVWLRLVKLKEGEELAEEAVLARTEPEVHPKGSLTLSAEVREPGRYALVVTFGEEAVLPEDELWIPFEVASGRPWQELLLPYLPWLFGGLLLFGLVGGAAFWKRGKETGK